MFPLTQSDIQNYPTNLTCVCLTDVGTVQLCAMAKLLEDAGFAFWYLTHRIDFHIKQYRFSQDRLRHTNGNTTVVCWQQGFRARNSVRALFIVVNEHLLELKAAFSLLFVMAA